MGKQCFPGRPARSARCNQRAGLCPEGRWTGAVFRAAGRLLVAGSRQSVHSLRQGHGQFLRRLSAVVREVRAQRFDVGAGRQLADLDRSRIHVQLRERKRRARLAVESGKRRQSRRSGQLHHRAARLVVFLERRFLFESVQLAVGIGHLYDRPFQHRRVHRRRQREYRNSIQRSHSALPEQRADLQRDLHAHLGAVDPRAVHPIHVGSLRPAVGHGAARLDLRGRVARHLRA